MDEKGFDGLNVIPLVDVMLVLLTIVLTTSTFIATGGIYVELPKAATSDQTTATRPRTISIDKDGRVWLEEREVSIAILGQVLAGVNRSTPLVVRADRSLALQLFVDVYDSLRKQGFTILSLQTEQN